MFPNLFTRTLRKSTSSRGRRFGARFDVLEDRLAMSSLSSGVGVTSAVVPAVRSLPFQPQATAVDLAVEPRDVITGTLGAAKNPQFYSFQLQAGDYLQAEVSLAPPVGGPATCQVSILNSSGTVLDTSSPNVPYGFRAPAGGTYYAEVTGSVSGLIPVDAYQLELHRLSLAQGTQSAPTLSETGSMYAFLVGNTLDITGPTGYGFGLTGNWRQSTSTGTGGLVSSTYTATGTLTLQSAAGPISLGIASGAVGTVTTAAQVNGQVFGAVASMNIPVTMNTGPLVAKFASLFGFNLSSVNENVTFDLKVGGTAGIALGNNSVVKATQALVDNAIPYLYFTINPLGSSASNILSLVYDPADPALYIESKAVGLIPIPGGLSLSGVGFSQQGLIPYSPVDAPSQFAGTMASGNLVLQGSVDTTAITAVPSKVVGSITLNFDPNHTGAFLGGANVTAADLLPVFTSSYGSVLSASATPRVQDLSEVFRNLTVGINGTLDINPLASYQQDASWWLGNEILSLPTGPNSFLDQVLNLANGAAGNPQSLALIPLGNASLIYDGPSESFYLRGGTTNPFAGTPLATLTPLYTFLTKLGALPTFDLDVAVRKGGEFFLDLTSTYNTAGLPTSSQVVLAHNYPVTGPATTFLSAATDLNKGPKALLTPRLPGAPPLYTGVYVDANVSLLGCTVDLQGKMAGDGDFVLQADAKVDIGPLTGSADFTLSDTAAGGFCFTASVDAGFSTSDIRGSIEASLTIGVADGRITYAGSVTASGQVYIPLLGWEGASASAGLSNSEIWISLGGYRLDVPL
jgi:hypothetical protein